MESEKVAAIIVAAGKGLRFGGSLKKQFMELAGQPILYHSIMPFQNSELIQEIILVVPNTEIEAVREMARPWRMDKIKAIVAGGDERHHSVRKGLNSLSAEINIVLIHDGVRPLVEEAIINRVLQGVRQCGSAIVAVTPKDTVKSCRGGHIEQTLDRQKLLLVQTPQGFRRSIIEKAYDMAFAQHSFSTDDAALVEQMGKPVAAVAGDYRNIKITSSEDLAIAEVLMKEKTR
jgi:2-C-methyl-D-erythritol 4-phosphate cytidylyltransferase